jgi:hypothetical protein
MRYLGGNPPSLFLDAKSCISEKDRAEEYTTIQGKKREVLIEDSTPIEAR